MGNPTRGTLRVAGELELDDCNAAFLWSDDSRFLAVPHFELRFGIWRRQRLVIIDFHELRAFASKATACYFQPESFEQGLLRAIREPSSARKPIAFEVPASLETSFRPFRDERWKEERAGRWSRVMHDCSERLRESGECPVPFVICEVMLLSARSPEGIFVWFICETTVAKQAVTAEDLALARSLLCNRAAQAGVPVAALASLEVDITSFEDVEAAGNTRTYVRQPSRQIPPPRGSRA